MDYTTLSDDELLARLESTDLDALSEACKRCGYENEYNQREQVIESWPEDGSYDPYTHQGLINYTDSILLDLCIEWLRQQAAAQA